MNFYSKFISLLFLTMFAVYCNKCFAAQNYSHIASASTSEAETLQGSVVYVPAGKVITIMFTQELVPQNTSVGSPVSVILVKDFIYNNKIIAQKGSIVNGTIVKMKRIRGTVSAPVHILFNTLTTPQGYTIPINAKLKTDDNTELIPASSCFDIIFTQPVTLSAPSEYKYEY